MIQPADFSSTSLVQAILDPEALRHNLGIIRACSGQSPIWGVVKANAYGHGVKEIVPLLVDHVQGYIVARLSEAVEVQEILREHSKRCRPILILGGVYHQTELLEVQASSYQVVIHSQQQFELLRRSRSLLAQLDEKPLQVWLKANIGMNRLGLSPHETLTILQECQQLAGLVQVNGVLTHFSTADQPALPETKRQVVASIDLFKRIQSFDSKLCISMSNSAHILTKSEHQVSPWHGDLKTWVRPGISMYGASPCQDRDIHEFGLKPVMTLQARIISIHDIQAGESVGYGATWAATKPTRLLTVAIGYGDGYPRHILNAQALWQGLLLEQAGRVSMDFTVFYVPLSDIQKLAQAPKVGDMVQLWGKDLLVDKVANQSHSIGYERLTQVSQRVVRSISR